jgi:hypothetical protein
MEASAVAITKMCLIFIRWKNIVYPSIFILSLINIGAVWRKEFKIMNYITPLQGKYYILACRINFFFRKDVA